jgi:FkbM family methyltransferase
MSELRRRIGRFVRSKPRLKAYVDRSRRAYGAWQGKTKTPFAPRPRRVPLLLPRVGYPPQEAVMMAPPAMYVPRKLAQTGIGGYEPNALACFLAVMDVAPAGPVWDVGANVGVYGLIARAATGREVVAFEPTPDLALVARRTGDTAGLPYLVLEAALSDEIGEATFYLSDVTDSSNSLREGFRESSRQVTVRVDTADHLIETGDLHSPAVLKVDTESSEPSVLRGALNLIRERRPWLLVEVLANRTEEDLTKILGEFGYSWYHISGDLPYQPQQTIRGDPTYKDMMWMFAPEPVTGEFFERVRAWTDALTQCVRRRKLHRLG